MKSDTIKIINKIKIDSENINDTNGDNEIQLSKNDWNLLRSYRLAKSCSVEATQAFNLGSNLSRFPHKNVDAESLEISSKQPKVPKLSLPNSDSKSDFIDIRRQNELRSYSETDYRFRVPNRIKNCQNIHENSATMPNSDAQSTSPAIYKYNSRLDHNNLRPNKNSSVKEEDSPMSKKKSRPRVNKQDSSLNEEYFRVNKEDSSLNTEYFRMNKEFCIDNEKLIARTKVQESCRVDSLDRKSMSSNKFTHDHLSASQNNFYYAKLNSCNDATSEMTFFNDSNLLWPIWSLQNAINNRVLPCIAALIVYLRLLLTIFKYELKLICSYVWCLLRSFAALSVTFLFLRKNNSLKPEICDNILRVAVLSNAHCNFPTRRTKDFFVILAILAVCIQPVMGNSSPRFVVKGSEIVANIKEGPDTPIGTVITTIKGSDPDGDELTFGIQGVEAREIIEIRPWKSDANKADLVLKRLLDREFREEYQIILTLTDGKLGTDRHVTQSLLLLVEDVNDNEPIFEPYPPTIYVKENSQPRVLARFNATDKDEGPYGQVVYTLAGDADKEMFSVKTVNEVAQFSLIGRLDYERKPIYQLKVLATDRSPGGRINTGTAAFIVEVQDVPDMNPTFVTVPPVTRIPEDIPVNSYVLQVHAIDGDRGINNDITYRIVGGDHGFFDLEPNSGYLYVKKPLDRENSQTGDAFFIEILAEEVTDTNPRPRTTTEVTVILEDVNDQTPTFRAPHYVAEVAENSQFNMPVSLIGDAIPQVYDNDQEHIIVEDEDKGLNGTFRLEVVGGGGMFDVSPKEGLNLASFMIRIKAPHLLDYEKIKVVNFTVIATEVVKISPKSSSALVTVHLTDANDNVPEFSAPLDEVRIIENSPEGTLLTLVNATDSDTGIFGTEGIRYTDIRGAFSDKVHLNALTGEVRLRNGAALDREVWPDFFLTVEARDSNGFGNRNSLSIHFVVEDSNDNAPGFSQKLYQVRVHENEPNFTERFFVRARDADLNGTLNHQIQYQIISGNEYGNFSIDADTGELTLIGPLDFEAMKMGGDDRFFNLTVEAYDLGSPSLAGDAHVLVYVIDVNDHKPKFEKLRYHALISETTPGESSVVQVYAHDGDGSRAKSRVAYRIESGAGDKFVIDPHSGLVSVARGANLDPDLTQPRTTEYFLKVIAIDGGIGTDNKQEGTVVHIEIEDINNKSPIFEPTKKIKINENSPSGSFVTQVKAYDPDDSHNLRYYLDALKSVARNEDNFYVDQIKYNFTQSFEINELDGTITLFNQLDREKAEIIRLNLLCVDLGAPNMDQTSSTTLTIEVQDSNDNNPVFTKPFYSQLVSENSEIGSTILNVKATDADANKTVSYSVETPLEVQSLLHLDNISGEIVLENTIDREKFPWLNFTVRAADSGVPPRYAFVDVLIKIVDENDNNPTFENHTQVVKVKENSPIGTPILKLTAHDPDHGENGRVTYLLDRRSSHGFFEINGSTGELIVSNELDREQISRFELIVEAFDNFKFGISSGESRNAFTRLTVIVSDVNDEIPRIVPQQECATVTEFHAIGSRVTTVSALDNDDPETPNGRLNFDFARGNDLGLFGIRSIDIKTAEIFTIESLVGLYGNYTLQVMAHDLGTPINDAVENYFICVTDFNDHAPSFVFPDVNMTVKIAENATIGTVVIRVRAIDEDVGLNGAVLYRLHEDSKQHFQTFQIDRLTGELSIKRQLDRERQSVYNIRIEAHDQGSPTPLSNDLDLTIYVTNVNDIAPQFTQDVFTVNFTENQIAGAEKFALPETLDLDAIELDEYKADVCYFILSGDPNQTFSLNSLTHELQTNVKLDREYISEYELIVKATEDCFSPLPNMDTFDPFDDTLLKVIAYVNDENDNAPIFDREMFSGGITSNSDFGYNILRVSAKDADFDENSKLSYYIVPNSLTTTLSEGFRDIPIDPFIVEKTAGLVKLNFIPREGMKGYFDFQVLVNDTGGFSDEARVFIYLLREDQRVRFVLRMRPEEVRDNIHHLRQSLSNVTDAIVNIDAYKIHQNADGLVDKTKTDLFLHLVNKRDHSVLEVEEVLTALDKNIHNLDELFKEMNVLETQGAKLRRLSVVEDNLLFIWLVGVIAFLCLMLIATVSLCLSQRNRYSRKLKAATATAFGSQDTGLNRSSTMPNTNLHCVEGSNPVWMSGFDNDWFKDQDSLTYQHFIRHLGENGTSGASIENNGVSSNSNSTNSNTTSNGVNSNSTENTFKSNLYTTFNKIPNGFVEKKLETTEL